MSVSYNGKRLTPAPLVTVNKTYLTSEDGNKLGVRFGITLHGTILPFRGSPNSNDIFEEVGPLADEPYAQDPEGFNHIVRKQEAIRQLFSQNGKSLEWQPGGQPVVKCNPRVTSISFEEGIWAQKCNYTIEFETERIYLGGATDVEDIFAFKCLVGATESWEFQPIEEWHQEAFNVSHAVTAQGIRSYDSDDSLFDSKEAWEHAKAWCDSRITGSIRNDIITKVIGQTWTGKKYTKSTVVDEKRGGYSIRETWVVSEHTYLLEENFTFSHDNREETHLARYDGRVKGLGISKSDNITKAKNAIPSDSVARTTTITALSSQLGSLTLPTYPSTKNIGIDEHNGTVSFSFEWNFDEDTPSNVKNTFTASQSYNEANNLWTITLTQEAEGLGDDSDTKVANAKAAILTDAAAKAKAIEILEISASLAVGDPKEKGKSINSRTGVIRANWSWTNSVDEHNLEVTISITSPASVVAILPIPGRLTGPIVQNMNTQTEERRSVTVTGQKYDSDPGDLAEAYSPGAGYYVVKNERRYSPHTKQFQQTKEWINGG